MPTRAVVCLLLCLGVLATGAAGARAAGPSPVHAAFTELRSNLRAADDLSGRERERLLRKAWRAERQRSARGRPCRALETLEALRRGIHDADAHVGGIDDVERAILRTRGGADCGLPSKRVTIEPETGFGGGFKPPRRPRKTPEEDEGGEVPRAPRSDNLPKPGRATTVTPLPPGQSHATGSTPFGFSTLSDIRSTPFGYPEEPSQASAGRVVWYTGNSGAAFSVDGGKTFTKVNPRLIAPEGDHAFCCDQVVLYAPQIDRFVWFIQYWCGRSDPDCARPGSSNVVRLLVASPRDIVRNRREPALAWRSWSFSPRDLGYPRDILDYPDLAVGRNSLYLSANMFAGFEWTRTAVARAPLADLRAFRPLSMRFARDTTTFNYKIVQGAGTRGFLASHRDDRTLATLTWDEGSPLLLRHLTRHSLNASFDYGSETGGVDWNGRTDPRITGATRRGRELWIAWAEGRRICTDRCRRFWPQPHVHVAVVDERTFGLRRERFIHNPNYAIAYPSLATDSLGRVGMSFTYGGGTAGNSSPATGYLTGGEAFRQVARSPAPGFQGDYFSLRRDWPDGRHLTGSGYVTDPSDHVHWLFFRYTRPRS